MMNNSNILYKICKAILILSIVVSIIIVTDYLFRVRIENIKSDLEKKRSVIIKVDKNKPKIIESPIIYDNNKNTSIKKPKIAIIVIGLGLSKFSTEKVFKLSNKITLGFSIYSHNINKWINKAKIKNHDILISLPMEPEDYPISDPGSLALMSDNLVSDNLKTLKEIIYKADYKYGVYTPINERFSFNIYNMTPILRELKRNNLSVIYSNQKDNSQLI